MRMRILGNVWREGRAFYPGDIIDAPEQEAERLAVLGVAEPERVAAPEQSPAPETEPVPEIPLEIPAEKPKKKKARR